MDDPKDQRVVSNRILAAAIIVFGLILVYIVLPIEDMSFGRTAFHTSVSIIVSIVAIVLAVLIW